MATSFLRAPDCKGAAFALTMGSNTGHRHHNHHFHNHHHNHRNVHHNEINCREREEVFTGRRCNKCWCSNGEIRFLFVFICILIFVFVFVFYLLCTNIGAEKGRSGSLENIGRSLRFYKGFDVNLSLSSLFSSSSSSSSFLS